MTQFFMSWSSALPVMMGSTSTELVMFRTCSAVNVRSAGASGFAGDGMRLTIQWSRSEIVRSEAADQGVEREETVK